MANNFDSNFTRKVMKKVIPAFETARVLSKNVDTQFYKGQFNADSGDTVDIKRPTDYKSTRTATGDISGTKEDIITGKASAVVQDYITVPIDFNEADQALTMGSDSDRFWDDAAQRIVTDLEVDFGAFMLQNAGLLAGTYGVAVSTWDHVAEADAIMKAHGVASGAPWYYAANPFTNRKLASNQRSLGAGGTAGSIIRTAHEKATLTENFAGFDRVMNATALDSVSLHSGVDRAGTLSANPIVTYVNAKDTMTQVLAVTAFQANLQVRVGEVIQITGRNRLNLSTRKVIVDDAGAVILWTATVTEAVTLGASGEGNITVTGPAIFEATGAYNTVDSAPISGDVVTLLGTASTTYQPNLFWHRDAFSIVSVKMEKLFATDTLAITKDGLQLRVSKYSDGDANKQTVRIDLRPAYAANNPLMAGQGFGS